VLSRHGAVEIVEPDAGRQRQALEGVLILGVEAEVPETVLGEIRGRELRDAARQPPVERVVHVAVDFLIVVVDALLVLNASLERVGPGDI
jgi:hypothetical protein